MYLLCYSMISPKLVLLKTTLTQPTDLVSILWMNYKFRQWKYGDINETSFFCAYLERVCGM